MMKQTISALLMLIFTPVWAASADPAPDPAATPVPLVKTLLLEKNLRLAVSGLPTDCPLLRLTLRREDPQLPGLGVFTRSVRLSTRGVRLTELELGPEFWPHRYLPGHVFLQCVGTAPLRRWRNASELNLAQSEISLDLNQSFELETQRP